MKKIIIGSIVGAILLFCWQSVSWMVLGVHDSALKYTPAQDSILGTLNNSLKEDGQYFIPSVPPGSSQKDMEECSKKNEGKPWAVVTYHKVHDTDMTLSIIRGFLICLVCVWLVCTVVGRLANKSFYTVFSTCLTFGLICFLFVWYMGHNWMGISWDVLTGELIDDLVGWGLVGIWLGWWYGRK